MPKSNQPKPRPVATSAGVMVLGMHRSGTSVLTRVLEQCGADVGARVLGGSRGNDAGHWEDAFAVETHERLLAAFGQQWDDVMPLPPDWGSSDPAGRAGLLVRGYLEANRSRQATWVVKDPRLCLFAGLWADAAQSAGLPVGAVIMLRHPLEIARSLAVRDGMPPGKALLLWWKYMSEALSIADRVPTVVVSHGQLLRDWRDCLRRIGALPGLEGRLDMGASVAGRIDALIDRGAAGSPGTDAAQALPRAFAKAWDVLEACAADGTVPSGLVARLHALVGSSTELAQALVGEARVTEQKLWARVAAAEGALVESTARHVPTQLASLREAVDHHHSDLIRAVSVEIRQMQERAAGAIQDATRQVATSRADAALGRDLVPRIDDSRRQLGERLAGLEQQLSGAVAGLEQHLSEAIAGRDALTRQLVELEQQHRQLGQERQALLRESRQLVEAHARIEEGLKGELEAARLEADAGRRRITVLQAELRAAREIAAQVPELLNSHSWRLTRPLRVLRRILTGHWSNEDTARLRATWRRLVPRARGPVALAAAGAAVPGAADGSAGRTALAGPAMPDVFVWAVIDWHFRTQRPQHLAMALAEKGHRVFYVSNNFVDSATPGHRVEPLDGSGRLFQVQLHLQGAPAIYHDMPGPDQEAALRRSLATLLAWTRTDSSISLVQHPYWTSLARIVPNVRVVYDCMDHHAGFDNNASSILAAEESLVATAQLVVVTSAWLEAEIAPKARATALIRNAVEYDFFHQPPARVFNDKAGRRMIGYYGAIAEWFDVALVRKVAEAYPDALLVLIGSDTVGAGAALADLPQVRMVGEVPYAELPGWLHALDVCVLPFRVIPLTLATNPVKVYEYLAAGKPVVAVDLPEMSQFGGLVDVATDHDAFVRKVGDALCERDDGSRAAARRAFAGTQTWLHRAAQLDDVLQALDEPTVSVVVLTYNNLAFTKACLHSIEIHSDYRALEVIVVDNASSDGSPEFLRAWAAEHSPAGHARRLILNDSNLGFAAGNNVGLAAARGEYLVMLNNDTFVTPGWVRSMRAHFERDEGLGLLGPVTNNIGNEARIEIGYTDMDQMVEASGEYTRCHAGMELSLEVAAFFCVMLRRDVHAAVGDLDEAFGMGFFEDDDYCRRVRERGWRIACAEDVFVHHHLSASFDALKAEERRALFERNKAVYEAKWGSWSPHAYRQ